MRVNVLEAKSQLSKLVKAALEGEEAIIARNGEPMVKLVPISKLFHLKRRDAALALRNLYSVLKPRAALVIDGVDIDMRQRFSREYGLNPLDFKVEQIHNEARWTREPGWPYSYWGLEPYRAVHRDALRRYATIFLR